MLLTRFVSIILIVYVILLLTGCGGSVTLIPDAEAALACDNVSAQTGHALFGAWDITLDPVSLEASTVPNRDFLAHINANAYLTPPQCYDCLGIQVIDYDPVTHIFSINVTLKNPTLHLTAYDVRGTILLPEADNRELINADAYTTIFANSIISPFRAFAKAETQRRFQAGATHVEQYDIRFPSPANFNVSYVADISWPKNQVEPYAFTDTHLDGVVNGSNTSDGWLYTTVNDWQDDVDSVMLDLASINGGEVVMEPVGGSVYRYLISNDTLMPAGKYPLWIEAMSEGSSYGLYYRYELDIIPSISYPIVDTGQDECFDTSGNPMMPPPAIGEDHYGQDAQYDGFQPNYTDNGNGTLTDNVTGLMWQQDPGDKMSWDDAVAGASMFELADYTDWRLPTIKELYSLINFNGMTLIDEYESVPYIDTDYFVFYYGDTSAGERFIDAQYWSSTEYVSTTMNGDDTVFGVNFADGRIKGYPKSHPGPVGGDMLAFVRYVRGNMDYGINDFEDNGDGTITDSATGLMWMQVDSGHLNAGTDHDGKLNWKQALDWAENLDYADYSDWRLPNAKELQSIVDYTRSPDTTASAAIDPVFSTTSYIDGLGQTNYPYFWTGTTHLDGQPLGGWGIYIAFGEALGYMEMPPDSGNYFLLDVHGAGAQRSDLKDGDPADFPHGHGPQGDVVYIFNFARCVRD